MKARIASLWMLSALCGLALHGCSRDESPAQTDPLVPGMYRATLTLPGGELPFGMEMTREEGRYVAYLINGAERVRVPDVRTRDGEVEMRMPAYGNRLSARVEGETLEGSVVLVKSGGKEQVIPFAARRGLTYRFFPDPAPGIDVSGRWAVTFTDADGKRTPAVGELRQQGSQVTGTFLTGTGDHRFLAGDVHGKELALSAFDGAHAYLYRARLDADGRLIGTHWSGLTWREAFDGRRDDSASLGDAERVTALRGGAEALDVTFPDLEGRPVSLRDPRFTGKVVIVALAGSWCPNCHDQTAFLAPYYLEHRDQGLEVIELMFEQFGDFERAAAAVRELRDKFDIRYETLIAGVNDKENAATRLPQLNGVFAFPTTIFIDRHGRVRRIHTGFSGPATGEHHEKLIADFDATVQALLAEAPPASGPAGVSASNQG